MRTFLRISLLFLLVCSAVAAETGPRDAVDPIVDHFMQQHKTAAAAVGIVADRHIVYVQSYGKAANNQPFDLASISKAITAIVTVRLIEQGKLELDAPVSTYLPEVHLPAGVTIKRLLSHTSGLPHYSEAFPGSGYSLANFTPAAMAQEPGHGFIYSSPGYYLLSKVLEKVSHESFLKLMNEELATPAGAAAFTLDPTQGWRLGSGGLMATPEGITHIALALCEGKVLSHAGYQMLWTPVATSDGYALGFYVDEGPPLKVSHNGSHPDEGIATRWVIYPEAGNAVIVLTQNEGEVNPGELTTAIMGALK